MEEENNKLVGRYMQDKRDYELMCIQAENEYQYAKASYNQAIAKIRTEMEEALTPHHNTLQMLENALDEHYQQNVLFPKYRNLVAVATMDEYLQSGRCDALEGSSGAYNLYEMELRQNIVIGTLNRILENMEQIRGNQYTLYEELSKANRTIDTIMMDLREMKSMEKLNAYFAAVTAKAAVSPKIIRGYIH